MKTSTRPHRGGQIGLVALLAMLVATGCVAWTEGTSEGGLSFLPAWAQQGDDGEQAPVIIPADAKTINGPAASFIVRFENEPVLSEIGKSFRRDGDGARAKFADWVKEHPEVEGLKLSRASYSGELILVLPSDDSQGRSPEDVLEALRGMDNLAYAELDVMAKASGE